MKIGDLQVGKIYAVHNSALRGRENLAERAADYRSVHKCELLHISARLAYSGTRRRVPVVRVLALPEPTKHRHSVPRTGPFANAEIGQILDVRAAHFAAEWDDTVDARIAERKREDAHSQRVHDRRKHREGQIAARLHRSGLARASVHSSYGSLSDADKFSLRLPTDLDDARTLGEVLGDHEVRFTVELTIEQLAALEEALT